MPEFDDLTAAAYKTERVAGRRLARRSGITEQQALRLTLEEAAGVLGLPHLLAARARERDANAARGAAKAQGKAARLALKKAPGQAAQHAWRAWFDGCAHPNPGRIGIGALLTGPQGERVEIRRRAAPGNSGEAEYGALIALLEAALPLQPAELLVYGDSQVVIDDVNRRTAIGARGLESQRARAHVLIGQLGKVTLAWIPRHKNGAADQLSQQAIALPHDSDANDCEAPEAFRINP
jgi:ribonuclease HI